MAKAVRFDHLRFCAEAARNFVGNLVGEVAQAAADALTEMDEVKADRPSAAAVTIPNSGWSSDSTAGYPKYYDLTVAGLAEKDRAEVTVAPAGLETAAACGLCPTCEAMEGKLRLRAAGVPAASMAAGEVVEFVYDDTNFIMENGKASELAQNALPSTGTVASARAIDGVSFNGGTAITHYGTCSTAGSNQIHICQRRGQSNPKCQQHGSKADYDLRHYTGPGWHLGSGTPGRVRL